MAFSIKNSKDVKTYISYLASEENWCLTNKERDELNYLNSKLCIRSIEGMTSKDKKRLNELSSKSFRENLHKTPSISDDSDWYEKWSKEYTNLSCDIWLKTAQISDKPFMEVICKNTKIKVNLYDSSIHKGLPSDITEFINKNRLYLIEYWFSVVDSRRFNKLVFEKYK